MSYFIHSSPLLRVALPTGLGIAIAFAVKPEPLLVQVALAFGILISFLMLLFWKRWVDIKSNPVFGVLASLAFLLLGFFWAGHRLELRQYDRHFDGNETAFLARLTAVPAQKEKTTQLQLRVIAKKDTSGWNKGSEANIIAYMPHELRSDTLKPGDVIKFKSIPQPHRPPLNPNQFDFGAYLTAQGFSASVYLKEEVSFAREPQVPFMLSPFFEAWRMKAIALFKTHSIDARELGVISALVLGKRDFVDEDIRKAFADAGTVHILAVSGLHVGIIYLFISFILGKTFRGRRMRFVRLVLGLLVLWVYAGITGFSPSVLRAATMFSFIAFGKEFSRFGSIYNMLAASAIVLLLVNPFLLVQVGFQLSYLAVLGIVIIHPMVYPIFVAPWLWLDKVWSLLVVSFAAQLATFPLTVHYFHQFPNYFLLSNLLVIPLATILLYAGIVAMLSAWIPAWSDLIFYITGMVAKTLNEAVLLFGKLPSPVSRGLYLNFFEVSVLYLLAGLAFFALKDPRRGRLAMALVALCAFTASFGFRKISSAYDQEMIVFHSEGQSAVAVVKGPKAVIHQWNTPYAKEKSLYFASDSYFQKRGVRDTLVQSNTNPIVLDDKLMAVVTSIEELHLWGKLDPDYLLLHGNFKLSQRDSLKISRDVVVIIDGSVPRYSHTELEKKLQDAEISYWNTARQGAIRL